MDDYPHEVARSYGCALSSFHSEEEGDVRKGPWTVEEDAILSNYVTIHGEGRWNAAARCSGLKRTGKSCRLRWLNYLRPNVRRGNITLQEQLLILELHSRWGNRWSKIAQYLPGRTDNEIKNYWRTRVQKQAKQLKCDVNSKQFRDAMRYIWMPRLVERIQASSGSSTGEPTSVHHATSTTVNNNNMMTEPEPSSVAYTTSSDDSFDYTQAENPSGYQGPEDMENGWGWNWSQAEGGGDTMDDIWNEENIWFLQQQLM